MINLFSSLFLLSCVLLFSIRSQDQIKDGQGLDLCGQILVAGELQGWLLWEAAEPSANSSWFQDRCAAGQDWAN